MKFKTIWEIASVLIIASIVFGILRRAGIYFDYWEKTDMVYAHLRVVSKIFLWFGLFGYLWVIGGVVKFVVKENDL